MGFLIKGKNVEVTEEVKGYIQQKLGRLEHHLANITKVEVELALEKSRYVAQVTIDHQGILLRGEERAADVFTAIDAVASVIIRQIERHKGKLYDRKRRALSLREELAPEREECGRVVKVKHFSVKPMPVEEAIDQMELLGHDFFIFFNEDSARFSLVYRRKDGNYGLIEPELG